jgi:hypothetical protein
MNRNCFVAVLGVALVGSSLMVNTAVGASSGMADQAAAAIKDAEMTVQEARSAIERGKSLVSLIPEDSPQISDVAKTLEKTMKNWKMAISALEGAKESLTKVSSAPSAEVADDFALLARVSAGVAYSEAKVVQISISYLDAIANNKAEALGLIRVAMRDALDASARIQDNYERVKGLIAEKYANE